MEESKTCTKCQETKSTESFNRDKTRRDGRFPHCRACVKEYSAKYYQKNSAQIKAKVREYQAANSDKRIEISRRWRANNLEKNRQYQRDWMRQYRAENPLSHRRWQKNPEALKQWRADNPDKVILQKQRRRIRELGAESYQIRAMEIARLLQRSCIYCGSKQDIQIDHVVPLAKGGRHSIGNLAPACKPCNVRKSAKFLTEWKLHESKTKL